MLHDDSMNVMRAGWVLMAVVTALLGIQAAGSPMLQITDCEIGMYSPEVPNAAACEASLRSYFGNAVVPVLAVPVVVCLIPVIRPRQGVSWLSVVALFVLSTIGFSALLVSSRPGLVDLYGFLWSAVPLAVLVAGVASLVRPRRSDAADPQRR